MSADDGDSRMLPFVKMEGLGNDYVYVDVHRRDVGDAPALARRVSDRRFGIGSDGLILVAPARSGGAVRMEMYNADGSRGEMCGNGLRCVARLAFERGYATTTEFTVETDAGDKHVSLHLGENRDVRSVTVDMGPPILERARVPMLGPPGRVVDEELVAGDTALRVTCVSMGNPHCVTFVSDVDAAPVTGLGPQVEHHPAFPNRVNVEFVEVLSRTEARQRTWERGSGETFACGTGACAVAVAGRLNGLFDDAVTLHLLGGDLDVRWDGGAESSVWMTGPAHEVFRGRLPI